VSRNQAEIKSGRTLGTFLTWSTGPDTYPRPVDFDWLHNMILIYRRIVSMTI